MLFSLPMLFGLGLTAGSIGLNSVVANQRQKAVDNAMLAERLRQQGYQREAEALNAQSQAQYENFGDKQAQKEADLSALFQSQAATPTDAGAANAIAGAVMPTSSNDIVTRETAKQSDQAKTFTNQQGAALAKMRSFGDLLGDTSRAQARNASQIAQVGSFRRGSQDVLPLELDAAQRKGQGLATLADILGGLGSVATMGAAGGATSLGGIFGLGGAVGTAPMTAVGGLGQMARVGQVAAPSLYGTSMMGIY